jgi:hypothetical protein
MAEEAQNEGARLTMTDVDAVLTTAVAVAILPKPEVDPIDIGCRAICALYNRPGCLCGSGQWNACHAKELYRDHVTAVVLAFKQAGIIPKKARRP